MSKFYFKPLLCMCMALCSMSLTACSDGDEPKEDNYRFAPLEEILGSTTWMTKSCHFVDRDGKLIATGDIPIVGWSAPIVALENGNLIHYVVSGPAAQYIYDYRFDRATGSVYVCNGKHYDMRIVSVEPGKIVVQTDFGILDRNTEINDETIAAGEVSYLQSELVPADEALMERIAEPDDIIDRRK